MPIVKAKYFRTKVGDPNNPKEVPFLHVPQASGHSEKEIEVSEDTVAFLQVGQYLEVDTHDLPYKRMVAKGDAIPGRLTDEEVSRIAEAMLKKQGNKNETTA